MSDILNKLEKLDKNSLEKTCYISIDVETTGPIPGKYSMIALGATVVGEYKHGERLCFYRELKPLNSSYTIDAMRIACLGLECLKAYKSDLRYNPKNSDFQPKKVLDLMYEQCVSPKKVMQEFSEWITVVSKNRKIVEVATPIKFDGMFTSWYFYNFLNKSPLGYSGLDINSLYKGLKKDLTSHIEELHLRKKNGLTHNALEDAIQQSIELEKIINLMIQ